jgi:hypothetical protein
MLKRELLQAEVCNRAINEQKRPTRVRQVEELLTEVCNRGKRDLL